MVRAIFSNGEIKAISPIPPDWSNGQELVIASVSSQDLPNTEDVMEEISPDDQARLWNAIEGHRQDQKTLMRREMGIG